MSREKFLDAELDAVHETAAEWFLRLQDPNLSLDATLTWQSWMAADLRHADAFRRIEQTWQRFQGMPRPGLAAATALAADDYDGSVPVSNWLATTGATRKSSRLRWALAASIVAVIGASLVLHIGSSSRSFETAIGENRTVRLEDGSSIALGADTQVVVSYVEDARRLTLKHGEALFTVAKDAARPFSVRAGSATVTALGTEFNVRRADDRVVVAVVTGRVLVEPQHSVLQELPLVRDEVERERRTQHLNAGDKTTVDQKGIESSSRLLDASAATAWQSGRLEFEREPLRYVLEDVNRYATKPVVMANADIGNLKITGTVLSDNISGWVSSLESAFALQAIDEPNRIVLRRRP